MAELNAIDVATKRYIRETPKLVDMVFQRAAGVALIKSALRTDYTGGRYIAENFCYDGLTGGSYAQGKDFDISEPQIEQQLQFIPKLFQVNVTLTKEEVQVFKKGENGALKLIDSRMSAAYTTLGAHLDIALPLPGVGACYTTNFNGFAEALNNNTTTNWNGTAYSTYGTITRGGAVGTVLNSAATNVAGAIQLDVLETAYSQASFGPEMEPNYGLCTYLCYSYIKNKFQSQQRFQNTQDAKIGFTGLQFNDATLLRDRYMPGTYISGTGDPIAVTYLTQSSNGIITAYPTLTAETLFWLNVRKPFFNFYISDDPEFQLGFTGFKPAQGNTKISGQVLFAGAITMAPRYHAQLYGITG